MTDLKIIRMPTWGETCDVLLDIYYFEDFAVLQMGPRINLVMPTEIGRALEPYIGLRLSILRTDLPDKPYLAIEIDAQGKMIGTVIPASETSISLSKSKAIPQIIEYEESVRVAFRDMILGRIDRRFLNFDSLEMKIVRDLINDYGPEEVMS